MGSMLIALGLYIVGIVIMGAVVFYVGKQVLEILSQPVAKIIVGAICAVSYTHLTLPTTSRV